LLIKPSVLILDESTSHLDSETEKAISESIKNLHHKTTQVIIAHRLSTILHADQIVLLDNGRVLAVGKHQDLLKNHIYKRLYELQFHRNE
jgi:ABC-type multidrug transport system fused ATPase/permease subunit